MKFGGLPGDSMKGLFNRKDTGLTACLRNIPNAE